VLLNRTHRLTDGSLARMRLPHTGDRPGLVALSARLGLELGDLEAGRMLRSDPRHDVVLCATVWTTDGNVLAGYAATGPLGPTILADDELTPGIGELLADGLEQRASRRHVA
jgi:hypothetical protein